MKAWHGRKSFWIALAGFSVYFGLLLVPKVYPSFGGGSGAFLFALSLALLVPFVLLLTVWSTGNILLSRIRNRPVGDTTSAIANASLAAMLCFAVFLAVSHSITGSLPSGSHLSRFDQSIWIDPTSSIHVKGDITPRQKMLADTVDSLPGKSRQEIERMLGPSLDTEYFRSMGRDLIYITGPQRDTFIVVDSEWLLIWLDDKGRFERFAVVSD